MGVVKDMEQKFEIIPSQIQQLHEFLYLKERELFLLSEDEEDHPVTKKPEVERGYTQKYQTMTTKVAISQNIDSMITGSLKKNEIIDIINTEEFGNTLFGQLQNGNWVMLKNLENGFTFCKKYEIWDKAQVQNIFQEEFTDSLKDYNNLNVNNSYAEVKEQPNADK